MFMSLTETTMKRGTGESYHISEEHEENKRKPQSISKNEINDDVDSSSVVLLTCAEA